jgi:DNA-binding transcriptional regulator YiaG
MDNSRFKAPDHWTAEKIKKLRRKLSLTQKEFGIKLGVHMGTVNRWENGSNEPSYLAYDKLDELSKEVL